MKVTLTSMSGNTKTINLASREELYDFMHLFRSTLKPNERIKINCDILAISGVLQGQG